MFNSKKCLNSKKTGDYKNHYFYDVVFVTLSEQTTLLIVINYNVKRLTFNNELRIISLSS